MAVRSREELLSQLSAITGENRDDNVIALIEDITDTMSDYDKRVNPDGVDWKQKYEENDKSWRDKYVARFNDSIDEDNKKETQRHEPKKLTFEDLFGEKEK